MARILTGIQSTGTPHLGNILGAIIPAIKMAEKSENDSYLFIANLHTLTQIKDAKTLREQILEKDKSYMFVANHTSMADIMLMLVSVKNPFVFVGKAELAKIPLFGFFYKRTCILVDRNSAKSRQAVFLRAQRRLKSGLSICIFPEGGVPEEDILLDEFKDGAFRLAINHQIPVVPLTFGDNKNRFSYTFFSGGPGKMRVKMHKFIPTVGLTIADTRALNEKSKVVIFNQLQQFNT